MKKSLFAMAAVTAFSGAAQAQSSVTVYGLLDMGYVGYNKRVADSAGVKKNNSNVLSSSAEATTRFGFKGTEDLGGNTSAFFTVEFDSTPNNRQTFVGLKKNDIGQFALGTQHTVIHQAVAVTDPGNANSAPGNLIYPAIIEGVGSKEKLIGTAYTARTNNQLSLNSATFAGFKANAMVVANDKNESNIATGATTGTTTNNVNSQNGWGLGLDYTWKKLYATANYQSLAFKNSAPVSLSNAVQAGLGFPETKDESSSSGNVKNVKDNQFYAATTYDFGILKAYAQYIKRKVSEQQNSGHYLSRSAEQIGVRSFITPTIEAWASGGFGRHTSHGEKAANIAAWQIGSNYWLSKRTNLYAIYGQAGTSRSSVLAGINGKVTDDPKLRSANICNYAIGVRHTF
jgi:predicted porin